MKIVIRNRRDVTAILRRRKWSLILPLLGIFLTAAIIGALLPRTYKSSARVLIEDQSIPRELVMPTVTSYAEQRLQTITQRIMSTTRLLEIITNYKLYPELTEKWTTEQIIEKMRKDVNFETITAEVKDNTGRQVTATIAFTLSYSGRDPATVQKVTNILASLYLEENLKVREQQTKGTNRFIEVEMKSLQEMLAATDAKIAAFKRQNQETLPDFNQLNLQNAERYERDIDQAREQIKALKERQKYFEGELAKIPTDAKTADNGRLNELRIKLVALKIRYSDSYPDVLKTRLEIAALEKQMAASGRDDPNEQRIETPAYITASGQLAGVRMDIESLKRMINDYQAKADLYRKRVAVSPRVEEGYKALFIERANFQQKYDDLTRKYLETRVSSGLEKEQMGERFVIIDSARMPERPISPNFPAILIVGLLLGIGSGVGLAAFNELRDQSIRQVEPLVDAISYPVLGVVPLFVNREYLARERARRRLVLIGVALFVVAGSVLFHFFVMDLDLVWARLARRLMV
jgi:polysaccharide chain length determinant protein (PEP-CTERM system associated)